MCIRDINIGQSSKGHLNVEGFRQLNCTVENYCSFECKKGICLNAVDEVRELDRIGVNILIVDYDAIINGDLINQVKLGNSN